MSQIHQYGPSYIKLNPPDEWRTVEVDSTTNDSITEDALNTNVLTFSSEAAEFILDWRTTNGVHNGIPYRIIYVSERNPTNQYMIFDGYIDISGEECFLNSQVNPMILRAPIVRIDDNISVIEQMAVITQGLLLQKHVLGFGDFVDIATIIESKKNIKERAVDLAGFGSQVLSALTQIISSLLSAISDVLGLSVLIGVVELLLAFVNAKLMIDRLIDQGMKIKNLFFPAITYYKGFNLGHMIRKGFEYKGYPVDFGELEDYLSHCFLMPSQEDFDGYPFPGMLGTGIMKPRDYGYTIMELIQGLKEKVNLRADVRNGVVHLKRRNDPFWTASPDYVAEDILIKTVEQYGNGLYKDDTSRVKATFTLNYTYDSTDCHTLTEKNGDSVEVHRDLINELDPKMNTMKGLDSHIIPWAMCVRKKPFDNLWNLFMGISDEFDIFLQQIKDQINQFQADIANSGVDVNTPLNAILASVGLDTILTNRTGCLKIDDNTFAIPKFVYMDDTGHGYRIPEDFKDHCGALALYNSSYKTDSPAIQNDFKGQFQLVKELMYPWSAESYVITKTNPHFLLDGDNAKFKRIGWNETEHKSTADIEIQKPFDTNITEEVIDI